MSLCNALSVWSLCNESVLCARCIPVRESKLVSRTHTHTSTSSVPDGSYLNKRDRDPTSEYSIASFLAHL